MNCQDIQKFAYTYLDGEFGDREQGEFETHLGMCPPCRGVVGRDATFRDAVRRHLEPAPGDPELQDRVHKRLREAHRRARMSRTLAVPLALAASIALAVISWQAMRQGPAVDPGLALGETPAAVAELKVEETSAVAADANPEVAAKASDKQTAAATAALRVAQGEPAQLPMAAVIPAPTAAPTRSPVRQVAALGSTAQVMGGGLNADSLARSDPFGAIRSPANLRAMVRSHVRPLPPEVRGPTPTVQRFLRERLPFVGPPPIADGVGVQLHGARLGQFACRPVVHYSYEAFGKPLTVLRFVHVPGAEPFEDPDVVQTSPGDPRAVTEGTLLDRLAGYSVLHSLRGGELTCLISELGGNELHHLIRAPTEL